MKKLFTLFMATVVAISMSALPQKMVQKSNQVQKTELTAKQEANFKKALELSKTGERKAIAKPAQKSVAPVANLASAKKVAKAAKEEIALNFDGGLLGIQYYEETGDWFMVLACQDETKPEYGIEVHLDYYGPADNYCGTFTTEDFDMSYSWMMTTVTFVSFVDITCTISEKKVSECLSQISVDAVVLGDDGNTYHITCLQEIVTPKAEIEAVLMNSTLTQTEETITFAGQNEEMEATIVANYSQLVFGETYPQELIDVEATKFVYNGTEVTPLEYNLYIEVDEVEGVWSYVAQTSFMSTDTVQYNIAWVVAFPEPTETIDVACPNLSVDASLADWFGLIFVEAQNTDYYVYGVIPAFAMEEGEYAIADGAVCMITHYVDGDTITVDALTGSLVASLDEKENWVITGSVRCTDNVVYNLHLNWEVPTPTETVKVTFETSAKAGFWPSLDYDVQLKNTNDQYGITVDVFGVKPGESFGWTNVDAAYTSVEKYVDGDTIKVQVADVVNGKLEQEGEVTKISASLIGFDAVQYDVELWYAVPTPTDTIEMELEVGFEDYMETDSLFMLSGYTTDYSMAVSFAVYAEEIAGTYVNDGLFGKFGTEGGQYDFLPDYTYVAHIADPVEETYFVYDVAKGQMVVTVDEEGIIVAHVDVIGANAVRYVLKLTADMASAGQLDYDEPETPVDRTYTAADVVEVTDYIADYGYIAFDAKAADGSDNLVLAIFAEEADPEIVIPEGVYPIDYSEEYGTVLANSGIQGGYVYPSFYTLLDGGNIVAPLWLLVGGTVEVSKTENGNLYLEVNAVNSYNVPVHVVYNGDGTGVENINVEDITGVKKMMVDGQLVIIRNGKAYNAIGAQVK